MADGPVAGLDYDGSLTPVAREAIRSFVIKQVAVPAGLLALLTGIGGYFLKEIGTHQAYQEAYTHAFTRILEATESVAQAKARSAVALSDANAAVIKARAAAQDATDAAQKVQGNIDQIAIALAKTPTAQNAFTTFVDPSYKRLSDDLAKLRDQLSKLQGVPTQGAIFVVRPNTACPDGTQSLPIDVYASRGQRDEFLRRGIPANLILESGYNPKDTGTWTDMTLAICFSS